jgi:hypothetical protein
VVYSRGVAANVPVLTGGTPSYPSGYFHHPAWDGPDSLLVNFVDNTLQAVESLPPQQPPVYTSVSERNRTSVKQLGISLPGIGDTSPVNELQLPVDCTLLARCTATGALALWQSGRSKGYAESRLLWVDGSSQWTLAVDPPLRFGIRLAITPDGTQCSWDGRLFNTQALLAQGVEGAPVLAQVAGAELCWFVQR